MSNVAGNALGAPNGLDVKRPLRVAAIGDLHVNEVFYPHYRSLFAEMSQAADILVFCGDLTGYGRLREAEILAEEVRNIPIPIVAVLGNHDHEAGQAEAIRAHLIAAGVRFVDKGETHEIHGVGFAGCMGGMGGFGSNMLSAFGESWVKTFVQESLNETMHLETGLRSLHTKRTVAVLHYSPVTDTLAGESPQIFPFLGNSSLAYAIDRFESICAVLHGHAHKGSHLGKTPRGIPVYNCAQSVVMARCGRRFALIELG